MTGKELRLRALKAAGFVVEGLALACFLLARWLMRCGNKLQDWADRR